MQIWPSKPSRSRRIILALLSAWFPLAAGVAAFGLLVTWMRIQQTDLYYVDYNYLGAAAWWGLVGLIGLLPAGWVLFVPTARLRWLWIPTFVMLATLYTHASRSHYLRLITFPIPHESAHVLARSQLNSLNLHMGFLVGQGQPLPPCISGPTAILSPYGRAGTRLFYQRVCLTTERPVDTLLASSAPGTIYVISRPGDSKIRLRATVLPADVSATTSWVKNYGGGPLEWIVSP